MDFTLQKYCDLLVALKNGGFQGVSFLDYCERHNNADKSLDKPDYDKRFVVLRHDVDLRPEMSLEVAMKEHALNMKATYYFRAVPESWNEAVIREISDMGHEIGFHYESLTTANGNMEEAWDDFRKNLDRLRQLADVQTICMHGSPKSKYDSKDLWKNYDYRLLGIVGEPYLDTDWSSMLYLTDTGRRWDGYKVSVRDKIPYWQDVWNEQGLVFHSTNDIIRRVGDLPSSVMMTTHPQRWYGNATGWMKELILQNMKNVVKKVMMNRSLSPSLP